VLVRLTLFNLSPQNLFFTILTQMLTQTLFGLPQKTFWVVPSAKSGSQTASSDDTGRSEAEDDIVECNGLRSDLLLKHERAVDWITDLLKDYVRCILAKKTLNKVSSKSLNLRDASAGLTPYEQVAESIQFSDASDIKTGDIEDKAKHIKIPDKISALLRQYVTIVSWPFSSLTTLKLLSLT